MFQTYKFNFISYCINNRSTQNFCDVILSVTDDTDSIANI